MGPRVASIVELSTSTLMQHCSICLHIGKLHRQIVQLQVSEGTAVRRLDDANKKLVRLEAQLLRLEHRVDDKDSTIYNNRLESRSKAKYLKHTIQEMRRKFSGAIPLKQQEKFAEAMLEMQQDRAKMEESLRKVSHSRGGPFFAPSRSQLIRDVKIWYHINGWVQDNNISVVLGKPYGIINYDCHWLMQCLVAGLVPNHCLSQCCFSINNPHMNMFTFKSNETSYCCLWKIWLKSVVSKW